MPKIALSTCACAVLGSALAGCQTAPARYAGEGAHATYQAAGAGVSTLRTAGGEVYQGAGRALRQPFHDLNMLQDEIPPVLLRAESHPYDLSGINSCADVLNRVAELDLALGPDVDLPKPKRRLSVRRADFAAGAALDAAGSAADHFIPMRSTLRQISGAQRYDNHVKHAELAGVTRRSFLKAVGMSHNCAWPAAPLDFTPAVQVDVAALWSPASPTAGQLKGAGAPAVVATSGAAPAAPAPVLRLARLTVVSGATAARARRPVKLAVKGRMHVPPAAPPAELASQAWRPASNAVGGAQAAPVSTPMTATPVSAPAAPWAPAFASAASGRP